MPRGRSIEPSSLREVPHPHPVSAQRWRTPTGVSIVGEGDNAHVVGTYAKIGDPKQPYGSTATARDALRRFVKILSAPPRLRPDAVWGFAEDFGQLGIDDDGFPVAPEGVPEYPEKNSPGVWSESVDTYLRFAEIADAVIRAARSIHSGQQPRRWDCAVLSTFFQAFDVWQREVHADPAIPSDSADMHLPAFMAEWLATAHLRTGPLQRDDRERWRWIIASVVNWWLERGHVQPLVAWWGKEPIQEWTGGLWGVLGVQLMFDVQQVSTPQCAKCHEHLISPKEAARRGIGKKHPRAHLVRDRPARARYCLKHEGEGERLRQERHRRGRAIA
jgi:hypothetical protein